MIDRINDLKYQIEHYTKNNRLNKVKILNIMLQDEFKKLEKQNVKENKIEVEEEKRNKTSN